ncbi:MAG: hypothetical protein AB1916_13235 [Thermodesulfobacteriota bacterium]
MAITCSLTLNTYGGLSVPAAYIKVSSAQTFKTKVPAVLPGEPEPSSFQEAQFVQYHAEVYLDAQARQDGRNPLDRAMGGFEWDVAAEPNILAACYGHLKAQETYALASDC